MIALQIINSVVLVVLIVKLYGMLKDDLGK